MQLKYADSFTFVKVTRLETVRLRHRPRLVTHCAREHDPHATAPSTEFVHVSRLRLKTSLFHPLSYPLISCDELTFLGKSKYVYVFRLRA